MIISPRIETCTSMKRPKRKSMMGSRLSPMNSFAGRKTRIDSRYESLRGCLRYGRVRGRVISALTIHRQGNRSRCVRTFPFLLTCCHRHCVLTSQHRPFEECIHGRFAAMGEMRVSLENAQLVEKQKCTFHCKMPNWSRN